MATNPSDTDSPVSTLKNESSRQRWELFHRAIAYAKQSNSDALQEAESADPVAPGPARPTLTLVR